MTYIFSDPNAIKLEINRKKNSGMSTNTWRLNNLLLNNEWVYLEIKEEIKTYMQQMKMKTRLQNLWDTIKVFFKREL